MSDNLVKSEAEGSTEVVWADGTGKHHEGIQTWKGEVSEMMASEISLGSMGFDSFRPGRLACQLRMEAVQMWQLLYRI